MSPDTGLATTGKSFHLSVSRTSIRQFDRSRLSRLDRLYMRPANASPAFSLVCVLAISRSMQGQILSRSDQAADLGQEVMKVLIREPVKDAVKEALVEQSGVDQEVETEQEDKTTEDDSGLLAPQQIISILGVIGLAIALRRLSQERLERDRLEEILGQTEDEAPMEEDMSKSTKTVADGSRSQPVDEADSG